MHAIELTHENLGKILEHQQSIDAIQPLFPDVFLRHHSEWYYVQSYTDRRGRLTEYAILPLSVLEEHFEFNGQKIQTDWDQIVRK